MNEYIRKFINKEVFFKVTKDNYHLLPMLDEMVAPLKMNSGVSMSDKVLYKKDICGECICFYVDYSTKHSGKAIFIDTFGHHQNDSIPIEDVVNIVSLQEDDVVTMFKE